MKIQTVAVGVVAIVLLGSAVSAQTLADVARKESERRKATKTTSKVYTNDDLRAYPAPPAAQAQAGVPAPPTDAGAGASAAQDKPKPAEAAEAKGEAYWKALMADARAKLERTRSHHEAMQTRVNSLTADFYARDDPAQRGVLWTERTKALQELDLLKQEIDEQTKTIAKIQEDARKEGVPPGWLR